MKTTICKKCKTEFTQPDTNKRTTCDVCRQLALTTKSKIWQDDRNIKRMAVYKDDLDYIKSLGIATYDAVHVLVESHKILLTND